jgi:hypothetical protein
MIAMSEISIYDRVASCNDFASAKLLLKPYFRDLARQYQAAPEEGSQLAYEASGLLSLNVLRFAPDDDPYLRVLLLAMQLEIPNSPQEVDASWGHLVKLIDKL